MSTREQVQVERGTKVVIATSVMLTFISFWRAAAIVLNDLGSSAFYAAGIAEQAVGRAAPWFILGVMLFSYAVRAVYIESCSMFTRGGVYRVVKNAMGGTLAKLSVSALMFDYILTGPISGVSAGQYIVGLLAQTVSYLGLPWHPSETTIDHLAAGIAILITLYFWHRNRRGIHESSNDALRIMKITTVMAAIMILWSGLTLLMQPQKRRLPPLPLPHNLSFSRDAVGWIPQLAPGVLLPNESHGESRGSASPTPGSPRYGVGPDAGAFFGLIGLLLAFGHSILAMSGEESLAQVNRELEYPKHKNLMRAGLVIFIYSLFFTSLVAFLGYSLVPDSQRPDYYDNLISGIAMNLAGPFWLRLLFQGFIVIVGFLMLSGAVNTAIIGSNGVLNRVSEDGVLADWFRRPHPKYGTMYRVINLIVILQVSTITAARGDVYVLGEAYAFGVIWSFAFNSLAMLVLRFKNREPREWKVPFNLRLDGKEIPIGLGLIFVMLFAIAGINLVSKQVATISGAAFTALFFLLLLGSERLNERRRAKGAQPGVDQFLLNPQDTVSAETIQVRTGNVLCVVRDYHSLVQLHKALEITDTGKTDVVAMTVKVARGPNMGYHEIEERHLFTDYEQLLFSRVVEEAEKAGKRVHLLVVPSTDVFQAVARTAVQLESSLIIAGRSGILSPEQQSKRLGDAWEKVPEKPLRQVRLIIAGTDGRTDEFILGAHAPSLSPEEVNLLHNIWLDVTRDLPGEELHHKDIVTVALARLERELKSGKNRHLVLDELRSLGRKAARKRS